MMNNMDRYETKTTEADPAIVKDAVREAYAGAAEAQRLAALPVLTPAEVSRLYGLSVPYLEKLRADNRGPAYVNLGRKILYTTKAIQAWMDAQTVEPRAI